MYLLHNLNLITEQEFNLSYLNRGFQYNDGLFDTLILHQNRIRFLTDHLDRIQRAMAVLKLKVILPLQDASIFEQQVKNLVTQNKLAAETIRIKINIWRKTGGLFTPESAEAETLITVQPQSLFPKYISLAGFAATLPNRYTPFSFFKGPYALHYVQASIIKKQMNLDELILTDEEGNISECLISNIFWIKANQVFTPALETGCIAGIMRLNVLRATQMLRLQVQEGFFLKAELLEADAIFTSNVTGLRPVEQIEHKTFVTAHPLIGQIEKLVLA